MSFHIRIARSGSGAMASRMLECTIWISSGWVNPWVHSVQLLKRANHQAGADQQHERERDLHYDERVARPMAFAGLAEGAADGPQRGGRRSRVFQERDESGECA
jgi:hypothetical protein